MFNGNPTMALFGFLYKIGIITGFKQKKHSFPYSMTVRNPVPEPKANWMPLAMISLTQEWMELIPIVRSETR